MKPEIVVEKYQASWISDFNSIRELVWPQIHDVADSIEHVGSTSVPGLSAKPIIDVDVIISDVQKMTLVIRRLESIGYVHRGHLGIEGREAFKAPAHSVRQNFYVCVQGCLALRNHLILRDHLRANAESRSEYGMLKQKLAIEFSDDIDSYVEAKTNLILKILALHGVQQAELRLIRNANLKPLSVKIAEPSDVDDLLALIVDLSQWLGSKGIHQWSDGYPREKIEADIRANSIYLIREKEILVATVTLSDQRDTYWNDFPDDAIYLHRLAVRRSSSGKKLGSRLIDWSEAETKGRGIRRLRLDCDSKNSRLREFYTSHGFLYRGVRPMHEYNMEFALFEKSVL